jgi:hypothetical protein
LPDTRPASVFALDCREDNEPLKVVFALGGVDSLMATDPRSRLVPPICCPEGKPNVQTEEAISRTQDKPQTNTGRRTQGAGSHLQVPQASAFCSARPDLALDDGLGNALYSF